MPDAGVTPAEAAPETPEPEGNAPAEGEPAEAPVEQPATPDEDADDDDDGGDSIKPSTAKKLRLRLPENDQVGRLTAAILQRNRDLTLPEAMAMANKQLGIKPTAEAPEATAPKSDLPPTVEAVDQTLETLEAKLDEANIALDFENASKLRREIRKLDRHRLALERDGERQQVQAEQSYHQQFSTAERRATELYEFAANPESPGGKRMVEIEAAMKEMEDPLYYSPDKPLKIAQMVAAELNIAPRRKGAPPAPVKPVAPPPAPAKPKSVLPGGASRTTVPTTTPQSAINAEVQSIKTVHDLRKFLKPLVTPQRRA